MREEPATEIGAENFEVLRHPAFDIPKARQAGDFAVYLRDQFRLFFEQTARFGGQLAHRLAERAYWMHELSTSLDAAVDCTQRGRHERAWELMENILDEHLGTLKRMSLRHSYKVMGSQSWYRLTTWSDARTRQDIFHRPFQLSPVAYRFSPPGRPALYLGNNVYVCWLESQPVKVSLESCRVARFEMDIRPGEFFLDLPANHDSYLEPLIIAHQLASLKKLHPAAVTNSPYLQDVEGELVDYLSLWPLLMAISVQKLQPAPENPPEYIVPQLLMRWVLKQKNLLGVRYFTSKFDQATNSNDLSINVVLPARTTKSAGFCDFLIDRARCTLPQSFDDLAKASDKTLFTEESAGFRQAAAGRSMIHWNGSLQHYQNTPFGRMEYWLDHPELAVARIDAT